MEIQMVIKPAALFHIRFDDDGFKVLNLVLTQFARCPLGQLDGTIHCEISRMFIKPPSNYHPPLDLVGFQVVRGVCGFAKRGLKVEQAFANYDGFFIFIAIFIKIVLSHPFCLLQTWN